MKIAQIAPQWERVPPPAYGGIELVVGLLTDELVRRGHEVTLFASGDSLSLAKLVSVHPRALRLDPTIKEPAIYEMLLLASVYEQAENFDIILQTFITDPNHTLVSQMLMDHLLRLYKQTLQFLQQYM